MSAALTELCRDYPNKDERLLAASSLIVKMESALDAGLAVIDIREKQVFVLAASLELFVEMVSHSLPLYPSSAIGTITKMLETANGILKSVSK